MTTNSCNGVISNADVDSIETVAEITVRDNEVLFLSFLVGTASLSAFSVSYKVHESGGYFTVASVAADYTSPEGPILGASGDLTAAASGSTVHWLQLDVRGVFKVRIQAAGTSSTITGHFGAH